MTTEILTLRQRVSQTSQEVRELGLSQVVQVLSLDETSLEVTTYLHELLFGFWKFIPTLTEIFDELAQFTLEIAIKTPRIEDEKSHSCFLTREQVYKDVFERNALDHRISLGDPEHRPLEP
jgi:hypothetical protein